MFGFLGRFDAFLHALHAHDRQHRHHLFFGHEWMIHVRLGKKQLRVGLYVHARGPREHRHVFADEIPVYRGVRTTAPLPFFEDERRFRKTLKRIRVEPHGTMLFHLRHELIGDPVERENLLLADAQQIVVVRRALNDGFGGSRQTARVVHEHRRIARTGADRALAGLHRSFHHARAAGDEQQPHGLVFADGGEAFHRRFLDYAHDVLNAGLAENRLIVSAHRRGRAA